MERMLSKAMHELERRQAVRQGWLAPLPVAVDATGGAAGLDA
jgi:hypothetical protein